jgi:hypothetical protein
MIRGEAAVAAVARERDELRVKVTEEQDRCREREQAWQFERDALYRELHLLREQGLVDRRTWEQERESLTAQETSTSRSGMM